MSSRLLHAREIIAGAAAAPGPPRPPRSPRFPRPPGNPGAPEPPGQTAASALERLRRKLSQPLDPQDPLSSLAPLVDSLRSARSLESQETQETSAASPRSRAPLKTFPALDELLGGGLPRGKLVEMVGARSSGRFSALLAALAAATAAGEAAALVDLGDGLDPQGAAALGLDLRRLLWLRPTILKQALAAAEMLLGGGFPLVVLDLGNPPVRGGRGTEAGWLRLARAAQAQGAALLVASPYRVSGTAAAMVLQAARGRARWHGWQGRQGTSGAPPWLLDGLSCRMTLEKCRGRLLPTGSLGLQLQLSPIALTDPAATADPAAWVDLAASANLAASADPAASPAPAVSAASAAPANLAASANPARQARRT
jgi:hypothetical protein